MRSRAPFESPIHKDFRTKTRTKGYKVKQLGGHGGHQSKKAPVHGRNEGLFHSQFYRAIDTTRRIPADVLSSARINLKAAGLAETTLNMIAAIVKVYERRAVSGLY